jgi:RNA polymerase sigma-70 factor (ECF subfamily)
MEKNDDFKTDEQIVRHVLLGGVDGFKTIVERYQKKIFSIGMRFYYNEDDSYDFAQEVFIKAFENLRSYAGKAPFRFWLTKVAYNHAINTIASRRVESGIYEQIPSRETTPEEAHARDEIRRLLIRAIAELPGQYRICVDLFFFMGLTYNEIGAITGYPVNTIKSHVLRAKNILRRELKGTIAEDYDEL